MQQWRQYRAGEAEHHQQRRDVADDDVLDHVRQQHFVGEAVEGGQLHEAHRQGAHDERRHAPACDGSAFARQRLHAFAEQRQVRRAGDQRRQELPQVQGIGSAEREAEHPGEGHHRRQREHDLCDRERHEARAGEPACSAGGPAVGGGPRQGLVVSGCLRRGKHLRRGARYPPRGG